MKLSEGPDRAATGIFGPVALYGLTLDRNEPAFGLKDDSFLDSWAHHWSGWLVAKAKT